MVKAFPVDYMHQACLGVTKKMILTRMHGKRETRMSRGHIANTSARMLELKPAVPNIFAHSVADLKLLCKRILNRREFSLTIEACSRCHKEAKITECETEIDECLNHEPFKERGNKYRSKTTAPEIMERDRRLSMSPRDRRSTSTESTLMLFD
ncbi:hypothetical protein J4Q44_G00245350 [Coregonus suidteri]|uniref:Uncharacterized protein n=1 Tax=Coregonus suidteri TaxID=861788 RepID=A0AAN8LFR0_9TELE